MKKLIFTADDFGWTKGVNSGIILAYDNGPITEISMTVNAPHVSHAVSLLSRKHNVGVHLNLTKFSPVLKKGPGPLVGNDGKFKKVSTAEELFERFTKASESDIRDELYAQFDLFRRLTGRMPTHLNTHHASIGDPKVLNVIMAIAKEYKIPVRLPIWMGRSVNEFVSNYAAEAMLKRNGIKTTNSGYSNIFNNDLATKPMPLTEEFVKAIKKVPNGVAEVVFHIGFMDKELLFSSSLNWQRTKDLFALLDKNFKLFLGRNKLTLVDWKGDVKKYEPLHGIFYANVDYNSR